MIEKDFYEKIYGRGSSSPARKGSLLRFKTRLTLDRLEVSYRLLETGERFIDLGCGIGMLVIKAADKYQSCSGLDIVSSSIATARRAAEATDRIERFNFQEGNLNHSLPFPDSYFDAVACTAVLAHVFDPYALIRESHRILKSKGILIVQVPNLAYIRYRLAVFFGKLPRQWDQTTQSVGILHYFTVNSLCKLLRDEGFRIEKKTCSGAFVALRKIWLPLFGADIVLKARKVGAVSEPPPYNKNQ